MEALGKTKVVIEDGKVVEVGEPMVRYCPLFHKHRGIEEITSDIVRRNIEFRIKDFGMCAPGRKMRMKDFLSFGVSELLGMSVSKGLLDCAVIACDGAGTVIIDEPEMIQGIGGRISGLVETSPIPEVIKEIGENRVLDPLTAKMDMFLGAMRAEAMGYRRIGVTVALAKDAENIRHELGSSAVIFAVHTSGLTGEDARSMFDHADIVTACASKAVWAEAKRRGVMQVGNKVPIFAVTEAGRNILETRLEQIEYPGADGPEDLPRPLV
jgi:putative methanogenesis marker protein 8